MDLKPDPMNAALYSNGSTNRKKNLTVGYTQGHTRPFTTCGPGENHLTREKFNT
jgi:hypothetical protein